MLIFTTFRPAMSMGRADLVASGIVVLEDQRARVISPKTSDFLGLFVFPSLDFLLEARQP